jgi:hypothetical protein
MMPCLAGAGPVAAGTSALTTTMMELIAMANTTPIIRTCRALVVISFEVAINAELQIAVAVVAAWSLRRNPRPTPKHSNGHIPAEILLHLWGC